MYNPQLETFLRVADAGSFNKAAEEMYITPTAVIKHAHTGDAVKDGIDTPCEGNETRTVHTPMRAKVRNKSKRTFTKERLTICSISR